MDIIARATRVVDHLIVGVAVNAGKGPLFTLDERVEMVEHEISLLPGGAADRVKVQPFPAGPR
jgi:pantetheine-phosphate adenylyltransferase